jgi:lactate dehydrogenase-like 2-hydroxyacid dehydrogenase
MSKTRVLLVGRMAHLVSRIDAAFDMARIDRADVSLLDEDTRASVRGVALMGAMDAQFIDALPNVEIIASFGVGYDALDYRHAAGRGVMVTHTPDVLNDEVADTAVALLLNTVRELPKAERWLRDGRWTSEGPYPLTKTTLRGRTVGIFGLGRIGRAIATRLEAFGLPISYHNRSKVEGVSYAYHETLEGLAAAVDTLICVAPGTPATEKAINARVLAALGSDGVLINVGRGTTVDEEALAAALSDGTIRAAGLDVFAQEPHVPEALLALENACLLPHVASASVHTRKAMADLVADNLVAWFETGRALTPVPEARHLQPG